MLLTFKNCKKVAIRSDDEAFSAKSALEFNVPSIDALMDTFTHTNKTIIIDKFTVEGCKTNFVDCCELFCDKVALPLYIQTH